jgi:hypothetical protein
MFIIKYYNLPPGTILRFVSKQVSGGRRRLIKIGIEVSHERLQYDLITHPARYFFILAVDGKVFLCIRTCDPMGEDITSHVVDGLILDRDGNLVSIFEDGLNDAILELEGYKTHSCEGDEYPITPCLARIISKVPELTEWIISSLLIDGRNLVIRI